MVSAQDYVLLMHSFSTLALMTFKMDNSLLWGLLPVWSLSVFRMSFASYPLIMTKKNVSRQCHIGGGGRREAGREGGGGEAQSPELRLTYIMNSSNKD